MWTRGAARAARGPRAGAPSPALLLMLLQRINALDRKPPLTLGLMGAVQSAVALMYALHFQKTRTPFVFRSYSLCPNKVVHNRDAARLLVSAFLHVDDWHVYHNMVSFLWKGYHLEHRLGTARFAAAVTCLLVLSQALVVVVSFVLAAVAHIHEPYYQCSVGFSGVLFALKVLLNHNAPTYSDVYGFHVPTKFAAWLELVVIHVLVPRSSFMGHMCGIVAGYIYVWSPGLQHAGVRVAAFLERWFRFVALSPPESPRPTMRVEQQRDHSTLTSRATTFESDAMLAQRLQDEEYQAASAAHERSEAVRQPSLHISQDELRRRRVERLQRELR